MEFSNKVKTYTLRLTEALTLVLKWRTVTRERRNIFLTFSRFRVSIQVGVAAFAAIVVFSRHVRFRTVKSEDLIRSEPGTRLKSFFSNSGGRSIVGFRMAGSFFYQIKQLIEVPSVSAAHCGGPSPCEGHYVAPYSLPCGSECGGQYSQKLFGGFDPEAYYRGYRYSGGACPASDNSGFCVCKEVSCFSI